MSAIHIDAGAEFIGNDGPWSPVPVQVGFGRNLVNLLPATSQRAIWTLLPEACEGNASPDCSTIRGGTWRINASSTGYTAVTDQTTSISNFTLPYDVEQFLASSLPANIPNAIDLNATAAAGTGFVRFGYRGDNGDPLDQQLILSLPGEAPYVGQLGLSPYNTSFTGDPGYWSTLGKLNFTAQIKSASWAYNAGAYYRNAYSSLTFGGYDAKRGDISRGLQVNMPNDLKELVVYVKDISLGTTGGTTSVAGTAQSWFIDSTVPDMWLPEAACKSFEDAFGLVYNTTYEKYFVDSSLHDDLVRRNASVTFTLSASADDTQTTQIFFPYAALNLTAKWPLIGGNEYTSETLQYFPLKRASDPSQFFLGRAFLQEAYLAADYNSRKFSITQATFDPNAETDIKVWPGGSSSSSLSSGAIAGIAVGSVVGVALIAALIFFFFWRKRKAERKRIEHERASYRASSIGGTTINDEVMSMQQRQEYFKPPPGMAEVHGDEASDQFKAELDARFTARGNPNERHELEAGSISRSSFGVSPLRPNHHRLPSDPSSFGAPSPLMSSGHPSPPLATSNTASPFGGTPPAVPDGREWFGGGPFELHGTVRHRPSRRVAPEVAPEMVQVENEDNAVTPAAADVERRDEDGAIAPAAATESAPTTTTAYVESTQTRDAAGEPDHTTAQDQETPPRRETS